MKSCIICGGPILRDGRSASLCVLCLKWASPRALRKARSLKHWYGITLPVYNALLEAQNHRCALCLEAFGDGDKRMPAVDHDHETGAIRGLIHQDCNRGLGHFDDDPDKLEAAARYLRTARTGLNAKDGRYEHSLAVQRSYRKRTR